MTDTLLLRIGIAVALSLLFGAIIYFGRGRKGGQGRRVARGREEPASCRVEPSLGEQLADSWGQAPAQQVAGVQASEVAVGEVEQVVDAIFRHYEKRGFEPLPAEHELMLNL